MDLILFKLDIYLILFIYTVFIFLFLNFQSIFIFWIFIELNLVFFLVIVNDIFLDNIGKVIEKGLFYFIIQSLGSMIFLFRFLFESYFNLLGLRDEFIIIISLILKIGLLPFHQWIFHLGSYLSDLSFTLILVIQKLPILIILFSLNLTFLTEVLILNLLFGSIFIFSRKRLKYLLISSSLYTTLWIFLFFLISPIFFGVFFINYFIFVCIIIKYENLIHFSSFEFINFFMSSIYFLGLPPIGLFLFKFFRLEVLLNRFNYPVFFIIWLLTFFRTLGYFKFFINYFRDLFVSIYKSFNLFSAKYCTILIVTFFSFFILI